MLRKEALLFDIRSLGLRYLIIGIGLLLSAIGAFIYKVYEDAFRPLVAAGAIIVIVASLRLLIARIFKIRTDTLIARTSSYFGLASGILLLASAALYNTDIFKWLLVFGSFVAALTVIIAAIGIRPIGRYFPEMKYLITLLLGILSLLVGVLYFVKDRFIRPALSLLLSFIAFVYIFMSASKTYILNVPVDAVELAKIIEENKGKTMEELVEIVSSYPTINTKIPAKNILAVAYRLAKEKGYKISDGKLI